MTLTPEERARLWLSLPGEVQVRDIFLDRTPDKWGEAEPDQIAESDEEEAA